MLAAQMGVVGSNLFDNRLATAIPRFLTSLLEFIFADSYGARVQITKLDRRSAWIGNRISCFAHVLFDGETHVIRVPFDFYYDSRVGDKIPIRWKRGRFNYNRIQIRRV